MQNEQPEAPSQAPIDDWEDFPPMPKGKGQLQTVYDAASSVSACAGKGKGKMEPKGKGKGGMKGKGSDLSSRLFVDAFLSLGWDRQGKAVLGL